jgi:hypothetical protein
MLRRAPALGIRDMPAVAGHEIVLERRIVTDDDPAGVRYVADVDVLALLDIAAARNTVPDLFELYNTQAAPVGLAQFLTALATAVARKWILVEQRTKN